MRWLLCGLAALVLLGTAGPAPAQSMRPGVLALRDAQEVLDAQPLATAWVDAKGDATIDQVASAAGQARFQPAQPDAIHSLGPQAALWLHYRLLRGREERHQRCRKGAETSQRGTRHLSCASTSSK